MCARVLRMCVQEHASCHVLRREGKGGRRYHKRKRGAGSAGRRRVVWKSEKRGAGSAWRAAVVLKMGWPLRAGRQGVEKDGRWQGAPVLRKLEAWAGCKRGLGVLGKWSQRRKVALGACEQTAEDGAKRGTGWQVLCHVRSTTEHANETQE